MMIAVLYDFELKPGHFSEYKQQWEEMVSFLRTRGAVGSAVHREGDRRVVIYSRWPDLETYHLSWPKEHEWGSKLPPAIAHVAQAMKASIATEVVTTVLSVEGSTF